MQPPRPLVPPSVKHGGGGKKAPKVPVDPRRLLRCSVAMPLDIRSFFKNKADPKPDGGGAAGAGAAGVRRGGAKATESSPKRKKRLVVLDDTSSDDDNNNKSGSEAEDEVATRPRPSRKRSSGNSDGVGSAAATLRRKEVSPEDFFGGGASKAATAAESSPSPAKKAKRAAVPKSPPRTATKTSKAEAHRDRRLQPTVQSDKAVTSSQLRPGCLSGLTFVFSGILDGLARDDSQELVKELGGRVTTAVSSKTDYLVVGLELEDGRPYNEGSKYKKALETKTIIVMGVERFYGLLLQYDDKARAEAGEPPRSDSSEVMEANSVVVADASTAQPSKLASPARYLPTSARSNLKAPPGSQAAAAPVALPSSAAAKAPAPNPYAKPKANPYVTAKKPAAAAVVKAPATKTAGRSDVSAAPSTLLWVDKYKPQTTSDILGNQDCVRKLAAWLRSWEARFNTPQAIGKSFAAPQGPWKAALLSGPPGIGSKLNRDGAMIDRL